ncbi:MAG TPA: hypothetical protein VF733_03445 [Candidatus Saccharimonadales bacterium]
MSQTKRLLFIGRPDDRSSYDTPGSMATRMAESGSGQIAYDSCTIEDLIFIFDGQKLMIIFDKDRSLTDYDGIFLLGWFKYAIHEDMALAVARYAEAKNIPLLNTEALFLRSRSKLSQYVIGALNDIKMTSFIVAPRGAPNNISSLMRQAGLGFPLIVKGVSASRGNDNYLVRSSAELQDVYQKSPEVTFVIQKFIPNDGDYRLLVMGDRVRVALHRQAQGDSHLNNTSQGGEAKLADLRDLNPAMLADSVKIAQLLRRPVTGVDMIVDNQTGEYYFLEANNMPQLSTGSLVPEKMRALDSYFCEWLADRRNH